MNRTCKYLFLVKSNCKLTLFFGIYKGDKQKLSQKSYVFLKICNVLTQTPLKTVIRFCKNPLLKFDGTTSHNWLKCYRPTLKVFVLRLRRIFNYVFPSMAYSNCHVGLANVIFLWCSNSGSYIITKKKNSFTFFWFWFWFTMKFYVVSPMEYLQIYCKAYFLAK